MVAKAYEERDRMTDRTKVRSVLHMQIIYLSRGDRKRIMVIPENISERQHEIRLVKRLVIKAYLVDRPVSLFIVDMFIRLDCEGECTAASPLGMEGVVGAGAERVG